MTTQKSIGRYISCIHRNFHKFMSEQLSQYNIGSGQFHVLMLLYRKDGVNQETLATTLNIDKATSARAIKKLEEEGYVLRKRDEHDKRNYIIFLTEKAEKLKPTIKTILKTWTDNLLQDISPNEKDLIYIILEKIANNSMTLEKTE